VRCLTVAILFDLRVILNDRFIKEKIGSEEEDKKKESERQEKREEKIKEKREERLKLINKNNLSYTLIGDSNR
jgi:hypothetical protein